MRRIEALLDQLVEVAKDESQNIMPVTIELVREGATMGDIVETPEGAVGHLPRNAGVLVLAHASLPRVAKASHDRNARIHLAFPRRVGLPANT